MPMIRFVRRKRDRSRDSVPSQNLTHEERMLRVSTLLSRDRSALSLDDVEFILHNWSQYLRFAVNTSIPPSLVVELVVSSTFWFRGSEFVRLYSLVSRKDPSLRLNMRFFRDPVPHYFGDLPTVRGLMTLPDLEELVEDNDFYRRALITLAHSSWQPIWQLHSVLESRLEQETSALEARASRLRGVFDDSRFDDEFAAQHFERDFSIAFGVPPLESVPNIGTPSPGRRRRRMSMRDEV